MHLLKKKLLVVKEGAESLTAAEQFYALAASSPYREGQLPFESLLSKTCDTALLGLAPRVQGGNTEWERSLVAPRAAPLRRYGASVADTKYPKDD